MLREGKYHMPQTRRKSVLQGGFIAIATTALTLTACNLNNLRNTARSTVTVTIVPTAPAAAPSNATATAPATTATETPAAQVTATIEVTAAPTTTTATTNTATGPMPKLALTKVTDGLKRPVHITHAGEDNSQLYVVEQPGRIRLLRDGAIVEQPFLDITDRVGSQGNEQGLLSVAFAPDYANSGFFFVNYTDKDGNTHVARFKVNDDRNTADPDSELLILKIDQPYSNHNGGQLQFGPDKMLYIGMGDGGSQGDPENRAQNPEELLGKLLRIDVSKASADQPYAIPPDNPKWEGNNARPEIWALGLRNPWRFSFDRATGELYTGDVGQNEIEEIDFQPANTGGMNYGWDLREGDQAYSGGEMKPNFTNPITQYTHGDGGCSVTGGYVYRGQAFAALQGVYVFGDWCSGNLWTLRRDANGQWERMDQPNANFQVSSFGEDATGELYALDLDGSIYKVGIEG